MKTAKIIMTLLALTFMVSCVDYYRMVTTLDRKGNVYRELYAHGDSAFMAGNNSRNPFLFDISPDWTVNRYDTAFNYNFFGNDENLNVKISKTTNSIEDYSKNIRCDSDMRSFAVPEESLTKRTRGFYTYYSLKVIYKKLQYEAPISIDNYLNKDEQLLWTQGSFDNYKAMNGSEMNDYLSEINDKATKWYARNLFEINLISIKKLTENYDLDRDKENIFIKWAKFLKFDTINIDPKTVCNVLDSFYVTTYFSKLYNTNHEILDNNFNQLQDSSFKINTDIFGKDISYELVVPGKMLQTNAPIIHSDTLVWQVDGMRLLFADYSLEAKYRIVNKWAFLLTGLLIVIAIGSIVALIKRKGVRI